MNNRSIRYIGYGVAGMHAAAVLICLLAMLGSPNGASLLIALILEVPFLLLMLAGVWLIGRIQALPFAYMMISSAALMFAYWGLTSGELDLSAAIHAIGTAAAVGSGVVSVATLFMPVCFPRRKKLIIVGMIGLGLLCVAAIAFLLFLYFIVMPNGTISPIPGAYRMI